VAGQEVKQMASSARTNNDGRLAAHVDSTGITGSQAPRRGHRSFSSAFEEAVQVTSVGARLREIRVKWNQNNDSYTWSVRY
jgi:hypothetical protein